MANLKKLFNKILEVNLKKFFSILASLFFSYLIVLQSFYPVIALNQIEDLTQERLYPPHSYTQPNFNGVLSPSVEPYLNSQSIKLDTDLFLDGTNFIPKKSKYKFNSRDIKLTCAIPTFCLSGGTFGNGSIDLGETCDPSAPSNGGCPIGQACVCGCGGTLCTLPSSSSSSGSTGIFCGNNIIEGSEQCDGASFSPTFCPIPPTGSCQIQNCDPVNCSCFLGPLPDNSICPGGTCFGGICIASSTSSGIICFITPTTITTVSRTLASDENLKTTLTQIILKAKSLTDPSFKTLNIEPTKSKSKNSKVIKVTEVQTGVFVTDIELKGKNAKVIKDIRIGRDKSTAYIKINKKTKANKISNKWIKFNIICNTSSSGASSSSSSSSSSSTSGCVGPPTTYDATCPACITCRQPLPGGGNCIPTEPSCYACACCGCSNFGDPFGCSICPSGSSSSSSSGTPINPNDCTLAAIMSIPLYANENFVTCGCAYTGCIIDDDGPDCGGIPVTGTNGAPCCCSPPPNCGNSSVDAGEECDDGNNFSGDSCSPTCMNSTSSSGTTSSSSSGSTTSSGNVSCSGAVSSVFWDGINYFNPPSNDPDGLGNEIGDPPSPWTAYKSTPAESCTGGGQPGQLYKWDGSSWAYQGISDCAGSDVLKLQGSPLNNCSGSTSSSSSGSSSSSSGVITCTQHSDCVTPCLRCEGGICVENTVTDTTDPWPLCGICCDCLGLSSRTIGVRKILTDSFLKANKARTNPYKTRTLLLERKTPGTKLARVYGISKDYDFVETEFPVDPTQDIEEIRIESDNNIKLQINGKTSTIRYALGEVGCMCSMAAQNAGFPPLIGGAGGCATCHYCDGPINMDAGTCVASPLCLTNANCPAAPNMCSQSPGGQKGYCSCENCNVATEATDCMAFTNSATCMIGKCNSMHCVQQNSCPPAGFPSRNLCWNMAGVGTCIECFVDNDCMTMFGNAKPYCFTDGLCYQCLNNANCNDPANPNNTGNLNACMSMSTCAAGGVCQLQVGNDCTGLLNPFGSPKVCNGMGSCVDCLMNNPDCLWTMDCMFYTCNPADNMCYLPATGDLCVAPTPFCDMAGMCLQCTDFNFYTNQCMGQWKNPIGAAPAALLRGGDVCNLLCDATGMCGAPNAGQIACGHPLLGNPFMNNPYCHPDGMGSCVACIDDAQCMASNDPAMCALGRCNMTTYVCETGPDMCVGTATPYCDGVNVCRACLADDHCSLDAVPPLPAGIAAVDNAMCERRFCNRPIADFAAVPGAVRPALAGVLPYTCDLMNTFYCGQTTLDMAFNAVTQQPICSNMGSGMCFECNNNENNCMPMPRDRICHAGCVGNMCVINMVGAGTASLCNAGEVCYESKCTNCGATPFITPGPYPWIPGGGGWNNPIIMATYTCCMNICTSPGLTAGEQRACTAECSCWSLVNWQASMGFISWAQANYVYGQTRTCTQNICMAMTQPYNPPAPAPFTIAAQANWQRLNWNLCDMAANIPFMIGANNFIIAPNNVGDFCFANYCNVIVGL